MDLKIGFRAEKQFRDDIVPFFVIIFYSDFSIFLFSGLLPLMLHQRKKPTKRRVPIESFSKIYFGDLEK